MASGSTISSSSSSVSTSSSSGDCPYKIRIGIAGDVGVGKYRLMNAFLGKPYSDGYVMESEGV